MEEFFDEKAPLLMKDYKEGDDSAITDSWDKVQSELVSKIMVYFRSQARWMCWSTNNTRFVRKVWATPIPVRQTISV